jgi:hypothetical protein
VKTGIEGFPQPMENTIHEPRFTPVAGRFVTTEQINGFKAICMKPINKKEISR